MQKRWVVKDADRAKIDELQQKLKIHPTLCQLLVQRGIDTFEKAETFFRPTYEHLHDPYLMKDMDLAVERIEQALINNERIMVYGDYDVDGTTAVALVYGFLSQIYSNMEYYIPDRYREGYGVSELGVKHAINQGVSLIIALDCGIKAVDNVAMAKEQGVDFIICDHHRPGEVLPPAVAVLDPKRDDCEYPFTELSGCGIGFKLVQAFAQRNNVPFKFVEEQLDITAVSIASDIVSLKGENRVLAYFGLERLNNAPRPGLKSLIETAGINRELKISDIVFVIGPRINAAGRLDSGKDAVRLLLSAENYTAQENAFKLESKNQERRKIDGDITREALHLIGQSPELKSKKSTVLFKPTWHKGVIGIVASRLIETYFRPTIILSGNDGKASGSARSVPGYDIYNAIKECSDLLDQFGGHKYAAGLTLDIEKIPAFIERFEEVVSSTITEEMLIPEIKVDAILDFKTVTDSFYKILDQFSPFGPGNMKPTFVSNNLRDTGRSAQVGMDRRHLKIHATQFGSFPIDGIGFNMGEKYDLVRGNPFDLCYSLDMNEYKGKKKLQMNVKDIKQTEPS